MLWRPTKVEDLEAVLAIDPYSLGDEIVGHARTLAAYVELVRTRRFCSAVFELPGDEPKLVALGGAIFVSATFLDAEIGNPRPGLNARIIASLAEGNSVVLTHDDVRCANTFAGLNVVISHACWIPNVLTGEEVSRLEGAMSYAFFQLVRGYRLSRLCREAGSREAIEHIHSQRVFGTMLTFDEFHVAHPESLWNRDRALFVAERAHCLAVPASVAAILFSYSEPILNLHDVDQQLLLAALDGLTDNELSQVLTLKLPALKKRWVSLFDRVSRVRPDLVPYPENTTLGTRGAQKRHRLLSYLREHPEELRPRQRRPRHRNF